MKFYTNRSANIESLKFKDNFFIWVLFTFASYRFLINFSGALDLALWDEAYYLSGAESFGITKTLPNANWAPLYTLWYYLFSLIQSNPVNCYYYSLATITFLLPLSIIFTALRFKIPPPLALIIGLVLLTGHLNLEVLPKPAHLALSILIFTLGLGTYTPKVPFKLGIYSVGVFIISYLRPEFFLSFILLSILFIGRLVFNLKDLSKNVIARIIAFIIISIVLLFYLGIPLINSDNRSMMAFGQHFAIHWTTWTQSKLNPQLNWELILKMNFGNANSYGELLLNNPFMFTQHIFLNVWEFTKNLRFVFYHFPFFGPPSYMSKFGIISLSVFSIFILFRFKQLKSNFSRFKWETIAVGIIILPSIISCILIFPRLHYVLIVSVLIVLWLIILSAYELDWKGCVPSIILPLTLVFWTPNAAEVIQPSLKNRISFDFIKLHQPSPIKLLESGAGIGFYFEHIERYTLENIQSSIVPSSFIIQNKINVVFEDYFFDKQPTFVSQKLWKEWLAYGYVTDGFKKYAIKGNYVYIK